MTYVSVYVYVCVVTVCIFWLTAMLLILIFIKSVPMGAMLQC